MNGNGNVVLKDYQEEAVAGIVAALATGPALCVMPTGTGKTFVFAAIAHHAMPGRTLVLAHRGELLTQAASTLERFGLEIAVEKAHERANPHDLYSPCVVASVQSLKGERLARWPRDAFSLVVVDEAHHALAPTYRKVLNHFSGARLLGVTATPERGDGDKLGAVFPNLAYEFKLRDAIEQGHLVRLIIERPSTTVDLSKIRTTAGDLNTGDLEDEISQHIEELVNATRERIGDRPTIVFTPDVGSAVAFADGLRQVGVPARSVSGASEDRDIVFRQFRSGDFQVLANCMLATEGFDCPRVSAIVLARPTKSGVLYRQMCLDDQTQILTKRGFVGPDDIRFDDMVSAFDPNTSQMIWSPILNITDRPLGDDELMVGIRSPSLDIRVTNQHRMVYRTRKGRDHHKTEWTFTEADYLASRTDSYDLPISAIESGSDGELPLSDHDLQFIGWFLTDGWLNRKNNAIGIAQAEHQPHHQAIRECLVGCGFKYGVYTRESKSQYQATSKQVQYTISKGKPRGRDSHLTGWSRLEPYIDKSFTPLLEGLSRRQLGVLLEAIHLGDGTKHNGRSWTRRSYHITTANKTFADRLQSLCVRRGYKCNISPLNYNQKPAYILHIKDMTSAAVGGGNQGDGRPTMKEVESIPGERVWCVESTTGAIVTRRNGKVAILGNCGRGTRLHEGKTDCLIVDFAWNSAQHKLVSPIELFDSSTLDAEVMKAADEMVTSGKETDPLKALQEAERLHRRQLAMRMTVAARASKYKFVAFDPFEVGVLLNVPRRQLTPSSRLVTEDQKRRLDRIFKTYEIDYDQMSQRYAAKLLTEIQDRRDQGLATHRQIAALIANGVDQDEARTLSFTEASGRLDLLFGSRRQA